MTYAQQMLDVWLNQKEPIESVEKLARQINPRCRIDTYLHTPRLRIIFPDGSIAVYASSCLKVL